MRYTRLVVSSLLLIVSTISCDVINTESENDSEENGQEETTEPPEYSTEEDAEEDIAEIHAQIRSSDYYGLNFTMMSALSSDIVTLTAEGNSEQGSLAEFNSYEVEPESPVIESYWNTSFKAIQEADTLIEYLPESELDASFIDQSVGEAKFLKALVYFDLVRSFGGVPLNIYEETPARATKEETYNHIIDLLDETRDKLPSFSSSSSVSREAATALLIQCLLHLEDWDAVEHLSTEFINTGTFSLSEEYADNFESPDNPGIIYRLELDSENLATWFQPESEGGEQILALHQQFATNITGLEGDQRNELIDSYTSGEQEVYYSTKFAHPGENTYLPILRISDIYLALAEALANMGGINPATEYLNMVRARAGLEPVPLGMSAEEMKDAIIRERSLEFVGEGHRWYDLARTEREGVLLELSDDNQYSFQSYKLLFPIPESALEDNPNLHQNPGY